MPLDTPAALCGLKCASYIYISHKMANPLVPCRFETELIQTGLTWERLHAPIGLRMPFIA